MRRHPRVVAGVLAVSLVAVVAVVVGLSGGWARTEPEGPRVVSPGAEVAAKPFRIRLDTARARYEVDGDVAEDGAEGEVPKAYVVVDGTLSLDADASVGGDDVDELVRSDLSATYDLFGTPQDVAAPTEVHVAEDGSTLLGIGPGLTYDVRFVFELDEEAVPDRITLTLDQQVWRDSFIDGTPGWFDPAPVATVSMDVDPLPADRPPAEEF